MSSLRLGVNVDHVATLRQARYATMPESKNAEPDLLVAARICERAGAGGIVAHLRSDRRHIQDHDIERLRQNIMTKLNLEMGNTEEIIDVALRIKPEEVCLVPEKREEITTEGGLDVIAQRKELEPTIRRLQVAGIRVSLFIDPTLEQVDVAAELGCGNGRAAYRQACKRIYGKDPKARTGTTASSRARCIRIPYAGQRRSRHQLQEHRAHSPDSMICPN